MRLRDDRLDLPDLVFRDDPLRGKDPGPERSRAACLPRAAARLIAFRAANSKTGELSLGWDD